MTENDYYFVKKVALLNKNNRFNKNKTSFEYKTHNYTKLFDFCEKTLISDVTGNEEFSLRSIEDGNKIYLTISVNLKRGTLKRNILSRIRLLKLCFENINEAELNETLPLESKHTDSYVTQKIYDLIRISHENEKFNNNIEIINVQHDNLIPILRNYQKQAVKWLLNREINKDTIQLPYKEIISSELCKIFYLNMNNLDLYDEKPIDIILPSGGILADEMGLGKTIEIISLILLHPRTDFLDPPEYNDSDSDSEFLIEKRIKLIKKKKFFCICSKLEYKETSVVECKKCGVLQHSKCVNKFNPEINYKVHICPNCWVQFEITSKATVIVTPASIKNQWYKEILKHSMNLKVFQYNGVSNGWINPKELSKYDIVLIDYNTVQKEIHFLIGNESRCNFRRERQYMRVSSPLMMINWWRVCLDEAQLVESTVSNAAQMVQKLKTKHRWSVTGTPIQKSINDLRGILEFLNIEPFYEKKTWNVLVAKFLNNNISNLMEIMQKIIWRTCKENVQNELSIPDQLHETYLIQLTDAEQLFYESQHNNCRENFFEIVTKLILSTASISQLNPNVLKKVLEPLKKLRQDCTVPVLFQKLKQSIVKKCLHPHELMKHLKSTNEIECKNQLRTITSSYNGLAALYIIRNQYHKSIKMYKRIIKLSNDYTGNISVDSLIQIHAIYNLRWIYYSQNINENERNDLDILLLKLEWKYLNPYYENLNEAHLNFKISNKSILDFQDKKIIQDVELHCVQLLTELENKSYTDQLLIKFSDEIPPKKLLKLSFRNYLGIEFYLCKWFQSLFSHRKKIIQKFAPLFTFIELIKPGKKCTLEMDNFIKEIFDCHLNQIQILEKEEYLENNTDSKLKPICKLCKANTVINQYECLLFDKEFIDKKKNSEGTWNPSLQETVLKIIINYSKNKISKLSTKNCEDILNLLDCLKKEFKQITKLWIEIEYMVKAYDELNMCIIRLQIDEHIDATENDNKVLYKIAEYEVDSTFEDLKDQLRMGKILFTRKMGRLRYLNYLENGSDPDPCPICHTEPHDKYTVLECGHHMCIICLNELMKQNKFNLMCAVCRNNQKFTDVYFVTMKKHLVDGQVQIKGNRSTKVEKIVSLIIKLRNETNDVKILLFSHWEAILQEISNALTENDILHRLRWSTKSVDDFKNLNITCLLLKLSNGSKGLNLIEATHVILVEPILNPGEELQAIGRVHRIGQTKVTTVHRFIVKNTIEEKIYNATTGSNWEFNKITIEQIKELFQ